MSLLADLLSKVKHQDQQGSVPPNLANIIQRSSQKNKTERKIVILLVVVLLFVIVGFGAVYFFESYLASPSKSVVARQHLAPRDTMPPPSPPVTPQVSATQQATPPSPLSGTQPEPNTATKIEVKTPSPAVQRPNMGTASTATETKQDRNAAASPRTSRPSKRSSEVIERLKAERDILIYSARSYEQNKNYSHAITDYKKALEKDPRNYLIMNSLANALIKTGAYEESIGYSKDALNYQTEGETYLTRARTIEPTNKAVLLNLALLYERLPNYQESLAHFQKLSEMKDIRGNLGMARVLEKEGKRTEAEKIYRNILAMDDADPQTRQFANGRLLAISNK